MLTSESTRNTTAILISSDTPFKREVMTIATSAIVNTIRMDIILNCLLFIILIVLYLKYKDTPEDANDQRETGLSAIFQKTIFIRGLKFYCCMIDPVVNASIPDGLFNIFPGAV